MTREEAIQVLNMVEAHGLADEAKRMAIEALSAEPTVIIRSRTLMPTKDFKEWAKRIREVNPNAVVIPCDAEVVSAEAEQVTGKLKNPCNSLLADDVEECKEQKSKLDLISREDAIDTIEYWYGIDVSEAINRLPSGDRPQGEDWDKYSEKLWKSAYERGQNDRPKGEWIIRDDMPKLDNTYSIECSQCGQLMFGHYNADNPNFCPNCGADMQLDK